MLLNFRAWESAARADGPVVDQRAALDNLSAVVDWNFRISKHSLGIVVSHTQFRNLAGAPRRGILVVFAAGLRVVQRSKPVGEGLDFFEFGLIGGMCGIVDHSVALVVEAGGSFGNWRREREKTERQKHRSAGK